MRRSLAGAALVIGLLALTPTRADAAGVITHSWMALDAIDLVTTPELQALLDAHRDQVEGGAHFPDSGYFNRQFDVPGGDYGEEAHWPRFSYAYADQIANDPDCGDLTDPNGPCAERIAHLMGALGHGIGDEVWDWLFEPATPDHGETYVPPDISSFFGSGGDELQMDIVAIHDHGRPTSPDLPPWPAPDRIVDVFESIGRTDITESGLQGGKLGMTIVRAGEPVLATLYYDDIAANMPWTTANFVTAPGGVNFASVAIAANYENLWSRMLGEQGPTEVAITYPAPGEADIPTRGWERSFQAGSAESGGGARNRITAVLNASLPYRPHVSSPETIPSQLPDGAMTLTDTATNELVPVMAGYPRIVPYNPEAGEHLIDIQPAADLEPCTTYRVDVTANLIDGQGEPVTPYSWEFTTDGCPIRVTNEDDDGEGSFRAAVARASTYTTDAVIDIDAGLTVALEGEVAYTGGHLLTIDGHGSAIDAGGHGRILSAPDEAATIELRDLTLRNGQATGDGGAVAAAGGMTVVNSTIAENATDGRGGGVAVGSTLVLDHATIADNTAAAGGDALAFSTTGSASLNANRSVIATPDEADDDCDLGPAAPTVTGDHTFVSDTSCDVPDGVANIEDGGDPLLGPLRNNSPPGYPPTMFPLFGSPLVDQIPLADCNSALLADERGNARPYGPGCDIGAIEAAYPPHGLHDVPFWVDSSVRWLTSAANDPPLMTGFEDGTFRPNEPITRGQFVRLLYREAGSPVTGALPDHGLSDVPAWVDDAVTWAVETGTMTGYHDGTFRPNASITRAEVARAKYRLAGSQDVGAFPAHGLSDVPAWVQTAVTWAAHHGLMTGFSDSTFRPELAITRGQVARADYRLATTPAAWSDPSSAPPTLPFVAP